ncbi:hypothetical protein [Treponema sp. Marseille-Q4130]|uniref:hypothetical protein n=1 Tax=Treponema sp. Marseille-Q4130 TaxID=2766702 RepID=UPI001651C052|nr:hypothetical protein [Treponema sp. Marseille-Q4130]MBC6719996.1 hypothetical protein [Treponema sp. Marseille-Q4130]
MTERFSKEALQEYGIFAGCIVLLAVVLSVAAIFTKGAGQAGIKTEIARVLEEAEPGVWHIGDFVDFDAPVSSSAACFSVKGGSVSGYACIVRMETMYGPLPAVFISDGRHTARFVGIAGLHGRVYAAIESGGAKSQIRYWAERIPRLIRIEEERP